MMSDNDQQEEEKRRGPKHFSLNIPNFSILAMNNFPGFGVF